MYKIILHIALLKNRTFLIRYGMPLCRGASPYPIRGKYIYVYGTYALICMQANEPDEAVTVCREGLALEPEYIDLHYILAYSLSRTGRKDEALNE